MGQLVCNHGFKLVILQLLDNATRQHNLKRFFAKPRSEGVERGAVDNLELRHGNAARDAQVFEHVVDLRRLLARDGLRACDHPHHRAVEEKRNQEPDRSARKGEVPVAQDALPPRMRGTGQIVSAALPEQVDPCKKSAHHQRQQHGETRQQQHRFQVVVPDMGGKALCRHHFIRLHFSPSLL